MYWDLAMKFVLSCYGTRGDAEPGAALACELLRRGHDVSMAVAPDLVAFAEAAGIAAVAFGPDSETWLDVHRDFSGRLFRNPWKIRDLIASGREDWEMLSQCRIEAGTTLKSLAKGADLLLTGLLAEESAYNVAEFYDIPLAALHFGPVRANGQTVPILPAAWERSATTAIEWLSWRLTKKLEDRQRHELALPKADCPPPRRISESGSLEIQAYDGVWFPGLAAEWSKFGCRRPLVGTLTMELPTDTDEEVASWIAGGKPPIFFGFGSIPVKDAVETLAMISAACAQLGERALICSAATDFTHVAEWDHVKVVREVNYAAVFPACRAVVHHGGLGTTEAGLRAGAPTLMLWTWQDSAIRGRRLEQLTVGTARRFSATTCESLIADLRAILTPQYVARARDIATQMTKAAESVETAANLLERVASRVTPSPSDRSTSSEHRSSAWHRHAN